METPKNNLYYSRMKYFDATSSDFAPLAHGGSGFHDSPIVYRISGGGFQNTALIYTRAGNAFFRTGGGEFVSGARDLVLLRAGEPIEYGPEPSRPRWVTHWVHFDARPAWIDWLDWPQELPGVMRIRLDDAPLRRHIVGHFARLCRLSRRPHPFHAEFTTNALENLLLWCRVANPRENRTLIDPRVLRVANYLSDRFAKSITLQELAKVAALSPAHLEELFKQHIGMTPFAYLESQRTRRAMYLLEKTTKPISEIAREVGFEDPFYFSKRFRRQTKMSPRLFRQRSQTPASAR